MAEDNSTQSQIRQITKSVGRIIVMHRHALNLSQEKLAEMANCHRNNIGLIERGDRCPSIHTLRTIANALGMKVSDILREAGE